MVKRNKKQAVANAKKQKWEKIDIDESFFTDKEFEHLISFEELTDYEIIKAPAKEDSKRTDETRAEVESSGKSGSKEKKKVKESQSNKEKTWPLATSHWNVEKLSNDDPVVDIVSSSEVKPEEIEEFSFEQWTSFGVVDPLLRSLKENKFNNPTAIQAMTLPAAILGKKDIVGAAETGSGKTLAFAIPILHGILETREKSVERNSNLKALILTPTRELAVQIKNHINAIAKYTYIRVVVIVGGLSSQKQERLLSKKPDIVIATPGRLWELIRDGNEHLSNLDSIKYLVIDETDRMVERGHFEELTGILGLLNASEESMKSRQNFVFSATLSFTHAPPKHLKKLKVNSKGKRLQQKTPKRVDPKEKLKEIMELVGVKENAKIVDITTSKGTCETLVEMQISCQLEQKDYYLYYFALRHPGRTIVFCNSINCVRRLTNLLVLLNCNPLPLHSEMNQKQRLKNLERFTANDKALMIATDVAARGLDISNIEHVIHYQVPKTCESYIHRSGRTARAFKGGLALVIMEPAESTSFWNICHSLGRENMLPKFEVDGEIFRQIKERVELAIKVEQQDHMIRKKFADMNWMDKARKEMDLASSDEDSDDDSGKKMHNKNLAVANKQLEGYKKQLASMLSLNSFLIQDSSKKIGATLDRLQKAIRPKVEAKKEVDIDHN